MPNFRSISRPKTIEELTVRFNTLTGQSLGTIANTLNIPVPSTLHHAKGWIGKLIEYALGATAGSKKQLDFPNLGIELKTLPINKKHHPNESTCICTAPIQSKCLHWNNSWVYKKLRHVLWVPIENFPEKLIAERIIYTRFLWKPSIKQARILQEDWIELTELLQLGYVEQLSAKYGYYLHIRPKAANSRSLVNSINIYGEPIKTVPKGFYLRTTCTKEILQHQLET